MIVESSVKSGRAILSDLHFVYLVFLSVLLVGCSSSDLKAAMPFNESDDAEVRALRIVQAINTLDTPPDSIDKYSAREKAPLIIRQNLLVSDENKNLKTEQVADAVKRLLPSMAPDCELEIVDPPKTCVNCDTDYKFRSRKGNCELAQVSHRKSEPIYTFYTPDQLVQPPVDLESLQPKDVFIRGGGNNGGYWVHSEPQPHQAPKPQSQEIKGQTFQQQQAIPQTGPDQRL